MIPRLFSIADLGGLIVLALMSASPALWLPIDAPTVTVWAVGFLALASLSIFAWRSERWPVGARGALKLAGLAAAAGTGVFVLTILVVGWWRPELNWWQAGLAGGPALALAIALCPCLTSIALAGSVRNAIDSRTVANAEKGRAHD